MKFYITRHGQPDIKEDTAFPPGDPPLTELGRKQARYLGEHLSEIGFNGKILSSPYYRAAETADIICGELNTCFYPEQIIREVADPQAMEKLEPMNLTELLKNFNRAAKDSNLSYPWWQQNTTARETTEQVIARVDPLLKKLAKGDEDILLVSHSGVKTRCIMALLDLNEPQLHQLAVEKEKQTNWNCSVTIIEPNAGYKLIQFRSIDHLPDELVSNNKRTKKEHENKL